MRASPLREPPAAGTRTRLAWYAYDLGNTTVEFAIPLYLTIWIIKDLGVAAWAFGLASAFSSWAIGLSGPYIGVRADERHERHHWFVGSVVSSVLLLGLIAFLPRGGTGSLLLILGVSMAANYLFQLSSLIYNASMLTAARGDNVVSVSATGIGLSYLGGILGIALIEALVSGRLIPGVSGRAYAVLPAALLFLAFSVPSFYARGLWQKSSAVTQRPEGSLHRRIYQLWKQASREHRAGWFLAGFFALNSSIMGLTLYLPLHVQAVTDLKGTALIMTFGVVVLASTVGAGTVMLLRPVGKTVWRIIVVCLTLLGLNALVLSLMTTAPLIVVCACIHGILSGALIPTVRAAFAHTFSSDYQALAFGLYGAVQRVSQGLGAALSPLAGAAAGGSRATAAGVATLGVVALAGVPLFARWRLPATSTVPSTRQHL
jgi:MFS-type transporter involved in bile tolerance (Atg22 family)